MKRRRLDEPLHLAGSRFDYAIRRTSFWTFFSAPSRRRWLKRQLLQSSSVLRFGVVPFSATPLWRLASRGVTCLRPSSFQCRPFWNALRQPEPAYHGRSPTAMDLRCFASGPALCLSCRAGGIQEPAIAAVNDSRS